jgi:hypothetical protein
MFLTCSLPRNQPPIDYRPPSTIRLVHTAQLLIIIHAIRGSWFVFPPPQALLYHPAGVNFRATSHTRLRAHDHITLQALSLVEKVEPIQVRYFTLRLRHQRSM